MGKEIQKLKRLIDENLNKSKNQIRMIFGVPSKKSDNEVWFYRKFQISLFNDEIIFIFENDKVIDITICQYFLWLEIKNIYYFEAGTPEYKEVSAKLRRH